MKVTCLASKNDEQDIEFIKIIEGCIYTYIEVFCLANIQSLLLLLGCITCLV